MAQFLLVPYLSFSTSMIPATVLTTGQQWAGTMGSMVAGPELNSGLGLLGVRFVRLKGNIGI